MLTDKEERFMRVYDTKEDILSLVRSFEDATISRHDWKHREHLIVALYYVSHHDLKTATYKMRSGILNLLANGFNVDLTKEMPYHETMTVFWVRTVAEFNASKHGDSMVSKVAKMTEAFNKDYPLRFYSRELLFSDKARARFVEGDIKMFDTAIQ
jgi:hypothetical protein